MADLAAIADRLDIEELLSRYAWALDSKEFDRLDEVFTPDAHLDYESSGGVAGAYPEVKAWLAGILPHFPAYQHYVTNKLVTIDGDRAESRSALYNPMVMKRPDGSRGIFFVGAEYHDQLVRTPSGWRIRDRVEHSIWTDGEFPAAPPG
jgi:hypothetical protein